MFFDLLHLGDGQQAAHYFAFCFAAILGVLQGVAARYMRRDLLWFAPRIAYAFCALAVSGSFVWFFVTDAEIFIPGLAGGELFTIFVAAFGIAVPFTRGIAWVAARLRAPARIREKEPAG